MWPYMVMYDHIYGHVWPYVGMYMTKSPSLSEPLRHRRKRTAQQKNTATKNPSTVPYEGNLFQIWLLARNWATICFEHSIYIYMCVCV